MPSPSRVLALAAVLAFAGLEAGAQYQASTPAPAAAPTDSSLKIALREGRPVVGATVTVPNVDSALTLANAGFDFLWIEMEHGPMTLESLRAILLATRGARAVPITRVPTNELWLAKRVLDEGSLGVVFPFTSTRELAERAVAACRYPPLGDRGFGPALALSRYGMGAADYVRFANENVLVVVIIERKEAVENIESIASVPGIGVLFVGVNDLSFSLGVGGHTTDPLVEQALVKVLEAGRRHGVPVGYPSGDPAEINRRIAQGFRFFQASSDIGLMAGAARDMLSKVERGKP
ncbi:MAG TPA: aldolase/citrate lyase family protein [Vicinamibacteria bacterium]|nr:aldolase/citrate lyase family protein [Vicinamibacteria bacterium]